MSHCADASTYPPYLQKLREESNKLGPLWVISASEEAKVDPYVFRSNTSTIRDRAVVGGKAMVTGNAEIQEDAVVMADVHVGGESVVGQYAKIETVEHYMTGQVYGFWFDAYRTLLPNRAPCVTVRFGCKTLCIVGWTRERCQQAAYEMAGYAHEDLANAIEDIVSAAESLIGGAMKRERLKEDK